MLQMSAARLEDRIGLTLCNRLDYSVQDPHYAKGRG